MFYWPNFVVSPFLLISCPCRHDNGRRSVTDWSTPTNGFRFTALGLPWSTVINTHPSNRIRRRLTSVNVPLSTFATASLTSRRCYISLSFTSISFMSICIEFDLFKCLYEWEVINLFNFLGTVSHCAISAAQPEVIHYSLTSSWHMGLKVLNGLPFGISEATFSAQWSHR